MAADSIGLSPGGGERVIRRSSTCSRGRAVMFHDLSKPSFTVLYIYDPLVIRQCCLYITQEPIIRFVGGVPLTTRYSKCKTKIPEDCSSLATKTASSLIGPPCHRAHFRKQSTESHDSASFPHLQDSPNSSNAVPGLSLLWKSEQYHSRVRSGTYKSW